MDDTKTNEMAQPDVLWLPDVPKQYPHLTERYLRQLVADRKIRRFYRGRRVYLARSDLEALLVEVPASPGRLVFSTDRTNTGTEGRRNDDHQCRRAGSRASTDEEKGPSWAKIDRAIIESGFDPWEFKLYAFLSCRQGQQGYKAYGTQYIADCLGWDP